MKSLAKHRKKIAKSLAASVKSAQHFVSTLNILKPHNLGAITLLAVLGSLLTPTSVKAVTTTLNFNDTAPTLVSGTALSQGAVYRFKNVTTGVDALVTIATVSNATLTNLDDNANPDATFASRFQPVINHTGAVNTTSYIRFNFQLVVAGTTTPASVPNVYFSAQDVDGGGANTIREFVETIGFQTTYITTPTLLQAMTTLPVAGGVGYEQINAANTQPSIGIGDQYEIYSYIGSSVSSFTIIGGNLNGSTGCSGAACPRQNSWTFNVGDVQKLDFGDAPNTYGDASHPVLPTPTVYFGTTVAPFVDGDDSPNYSVNANGDDTNGTDDENGVTTFPALTQSSTSYSVTAACKGTNAAVSAWIDFNRNNTFEATERTTGTCNNTSVLLNWTGLSSLSAGTTYARFRTATSATEIANPTGVASNGEVEDYTLTIAAVSATISGTLYQDANNDNALTTGETRLPANVDVELLNSAGTVIATVQTNATGDYTFTNVPTGTGYQARVVTSDPQIPSTYIIGTTNPITGINITAGATVTNQNFGFDANAPVLTVAKTTNTPITNAGSTATYIITVSNAAGKLTATEVNISDILPSGFTYDATLGTPTLSGSATRTTTSNPTTGTATPSWGSFSIPAGGSVSIAFIANVNSNVPGGTYNNPVTVAFKDSAGGLRTASYNETSSTAEDVTVNAIPSPPRAPSVPTGGICAVTGKDGPVATLSGVVNTYYPGTGSPSAGSTSITIGAGVGALTPISPGDLLLVIQMQDASINSSNTSSYGSGSSTNDGSGQTSMGNSGVYEYVVATNSVPINGGALTFRGASSAKGLINSYTDANFTGARGQRRFQVVRVPQYSNATLTSTLTAQEWNGKVGGIVALDVVGELNFNGRTLDAINRGFRAGYSQKNTSGNSTTAYTGSTSTAIGAGKGEGTGGTPQFVWNGTTAIDNGSNGYPGGDYGRGAPANAGGGGNFHNAGGGGGGNGGIGGKGGIPWAGVGGPLDTGGRPGNLSSTVAPAISRLILGGGGGGGDANNATTGVRGGVGGGIAILRAGRIAGGGTILANGDDGDVGVFANAPDGAGGGGAGGTVIISSRNSSPTANVNIQANGGKGGNTLNDANDEHGPGGGGGGGVVLYNMPGGSITSSVNGGASGKSNGGAGISHGAAAGTLGQVNSFTATDDAFATVNNTGCLPQLTVLKTTSTPDATAGGKATYTITVSNGSGRSDAIDVRISDVLPSNFTYDATSAVNVSGGATRTTTTNPTAGATSPIWDKFTIPAAGKVEITFTVNVGSNVAAGIYQNPATAEYLDPVRTTATGTTSATYNSASSTGEDVKVGSNPKLLLVKRITAINGNTSNGTVDLTQVVDDPNTTDDNNAKWPANYLKGAIDGGKVKPGDELEYTIYFLSSGNTAINNVSICDLMPVSTTFVPAAFTSNSGITLAIGSTTPVFLTNASDTDGGQFIVAGTETPGSCNKAAFSNSTPPPLPAAQNLAGAVVVDVVTGSTTFPANTTGSPAYGFIRLRAKVK